MAWQRLRWLKWASFWGIMLAVVGWPRAASAWLFEEHALIGQRSVQTLTPAERGTLQKLWRAWRDSAPDGARLCSDAAFGDGKIDAIDCAHFGTLSAIGGDHSCSPADLELVLRSKWIRKIIRKAGETQRELTNTIDAEERTDIWINSHVQNELDDAEYLSRASINNAHFLRYREGNEFAAYLRAAFSTAEAPNALSVYVIYHAAALALAQKLSGLPTGSDEYVAVARRVLLAESYALHFLQDVFSAGHMVGTWGKSAYRMGTHDYYCEHGVDSRSWNGDSFSAHGDAHMQPKDLERAAHAARVSLRQVLAAARSDQPAPGAASSADQNAFEAFDSCKATKNPATLAAYSDSPGVLAVLVQTPIPGKGESDAHLPRFRVEVGPFMRFFSAGRFGGAFDGFASPLPWYTPRPAGALELALGAGYGLEGITNRKADGQMFAQIALVSHTSERDGLCRDCPEDTRHRHGPARVPARIGVGFRLRLPFWLLPGDLALAGLVLPWTNLRSYEEMAIKSANGGLLPWQRVLLTGAGRFQFILGREVGFTWYGHLFGAYNYCDFVGADPTTRTKRYACMDFRSFELDLPFLEYRPLRVFDARTTSTLSVQSGVTLEFPHITESNPATPAPDLGTSVTLYVRVGFDGRIYFD